MDIDFERIKHPLGLLSDIQCLKTSQGLVAEDLEVAILKVVVHITNVAEKEGQLVVIWPGEWTFDPSWRPRWLDPQKVAADIHAVRCCEEWGDLFCNM